MEYPLCARQSYRHSVDSTNKADKNPCCNGDVILVERPEK